MAEPSAASSSSGQTVLVYIKRKHGTVLLHAGHQYHKKRQHKSGLFVWECFKRKLKCRGLLKTKNDRIIEEKPHQCSPDFTKNEKDAIIYNLKQKLTTPRFPSVPKIYNESLGSLNNASTELLQQIPRFNSLKSSLYRYRNAAAKLPKIQSKTVEQVKVPPDYQHFLLADYTQGNRRIIVFASEKARQILCELTDFYADGTFKSCSPPFDQLYTIHGDVGSSQNRTNMMPLVYALMSDRRTESYEILFTMISAQIPDWNPIKFKMDFERAAMNAVTKVFSSVVLKGCYYHYNKAIWAKGRELKLINAKDVKKQRIVALSAVLPLLPEREIMNGWAYITRHKSEDPNVIKFQTYMERQWLKETFIPVWCVFGEHQRTTNFVEGWHHKLNSAVGKKAPNLMHLLHSLQEDSSFYTAQIRQENNEKSMKKKNEKSIHRNEFIQDSQIELTLGGIEVGHFLEMVRR